MTDWDPNDYQGRSQHQVEGAHKINNVIITIFIIMLTAILLFK